MLAGVSSQADTPAGGLTAEQLMLAGVSSQADTPAGRLTAAQLMLAGVSPESAACVAEQVDALGGMPSGESDTDGSDTEAAMAAEQAIVAVMLGCLTPEEMALLSGPASDRWLRSRQTGR